MRVSRVAVACVAACLAFVLPDAPRAKDPENPYNDPPPLQATRGIADCPAPKQRQLTPDDARAQAHNRIERGTSCWLEGKCEPGGDYKRDPEITRRVAAVIAADARFSSTSLWVETLRMFVTIKGCLADRAQSRELEALVKSVEGVKLVWQEAIVKPHARRSEPSNSQRNPMS